MKKLILFIQKQHRQFYLILVFAMSAAAILYVYPGQVQFKYDFQRGKVWAHENLVAPFQFSIQKSSKDIAAERKMLEEKKDLYFDKNTEIGEAQVRDWLANWPGLEMPDSIKKIDSAKAVETLEFVFRRGIIEKIEESTEPEKHNFYISDNHTASQFLPEDYFTLEQATKFVGNAVVDERIGQELVSYLMPNINFNYQRTNDILAQKVDNIIVNRGVVNQGEIIIRKGSIVDDEKYLVLLSLKKAYEKNTANESFPFQHMAGQLLYILLLLGSLYSFILYFRKELLSYIANINLVLFTIVWMVVLSVFLIQFNTEFVYILPFPIVPIIIRAFYDARFALFVHIVTILLVGYYAPNSFEFILIEFIAGMSAIINVSGLYKRSQLFFAAAKIIGTYLLAYSAFLLLEESSIGQEQWQAMGYLTASGVFSLFAFPLIYLYEKIFGQVSDLTLLELADTNSPLLRKLAQNAPGTFHHSVQVANLAETAALHIGANTLLVRTGALYHDIGKMNSPMYFVENQSTGVNPHDELSNEESAQIIISHVIDGVKKAKKNRLPELLIDFIRTHHGTSRVEYFYRQFVKDAPDPDAVSDKKFRYPGPKPFSKETAILMMADAVEAASRSLKVKSAENLNNLVDSIVEGKLSGGQFNNADITLKEIEQIKSILKRQLGNIYHARIEYPEKMK